MLSIQRQTATAQSASFSFSTSNILSLSVNKTGDLPTLYELISNPCPKTKAKLVQVQNITRTLHEGHLSETDKLKLKTQLDYLKKDLGFYFPSGTNEKGHLSTNLVFNGCIGFDYDFRFKGGDLVAKAVKEALKQFNFISLVHLSSGGYGVKGIIQTDLKECDTDLYKFAEKQIFSFLASKGVSFPYDPHGYSKTCYFAYDKDAYINLENKPFHIDLEAYETQKAFQKRSISISKADNGDEVRQAANFLIERKITVANSYDEYLTFTRACLNTFGTEGGDIAFEILENSDSFNVSTFKKNFEDNVKRLSLPSNGGHATERTILFHAREHGFEFQQTAVSRQLDDYSFSNLALFTIDRYKAVERIKEDTERKLIICESSFIETIEKELNAKRFDGKTFEGLTGVCTYSDISKLNIDISKSVNTYIFGSHNFTNKTYANTVNEVERLAVHTNIVLFADTPTYLNLASSITIIDVHTPNTNTILSDNPQATFVELIKKHLPTDVQFCDTHESVKKQLSDYQSVKRSELYAADHKKTLYVLFDSKVGMTPETFTQFENVVFVANSESKTAINMSTFCSALDNDVATTLRFTDTSFFNGSIEKGLFEDVTRKNIPIRHTNGKWEQCPNMTGILENEHQIKILYSDAAELQKHIDRISVSTHETAKISEETAEISEDIKQAKRDLAAEKKTEFHEFLENAGSEGVMSMDDLNSYVAKLGDDMTRGAKVAFNRIKLLSKLNNDFSTCFYAVKDSYNKWTQTRGRFRASKTVKTNTKTGKAIQLFRDTTEGGQYTKIELIEMARVMLPMVKGSDKDVWKQLKTYCFLMQKNVMRNGERYSIYEIAFLE